MSVPGKLRVVVSGASGMLGKAVIKALSVPSALNHFHPEVYRLVRSEPKSADEIYWDPYEMRIDLKRLEGVDAVVHLAGENIGSGEGLLAFTGRWTERKKHHIMESRRRGTQLLAQAISALKDKPKVFVSASGVGYYGDGGDRELTEASKKGEGFLSDVAAVWEDSCALARKAGVRTVNLRFGIILAPDGGVLEKLWLPTFMGLSGPIGSGSQFVSWITKDDAVRAIQHAIARPELEGAVNACSPNPTRQSAFISAYAGALGRPAFVPMPEAAVRAVFGEMGEETLLVSQRAVPEKLLASGFRFMHPDVATAMAAVVRS